MPKNAGFTRFWAAFKAIRPKFKNQHGITKPSYPLTFYARSGRPNLRMQPTACGAQDRCFFEVVVCCAPSAAADAQDVGAQQARRNSLTCAIYDMML